MYLICYLRPAAHFFMLATLTTTVFAGYSMYSCLQRLVSFIYFSCVRYRLYFQPTFPKIYAGMYLGTAK